MRLGAIILAGGRGTRMGRPKESLPFGEDTLLGRACAALRAVAAPLVVVARDAAQELPLLPPDVERTHDAVPDAGPLAGIAAGLAWLAENAAFTPADAAFVAACDHPFVDARVVRHLVGALGAHELAVPELDGVLQPLCAVYRLSLRAHVDAALRTAPRSARELAAAAVARGAARAVTAAELRALDPELRTLRDVDTPADYDAARRLLP